MHGVCDQTDKLPPAQHTHSHTYKQHKPQSCTLKSATFSRVAVATLPYLIFKLRVCMSCIYVFRDIHLKIIQDVSRASLSSSSLSSTPHTASVRTRHSLDMAASLCYTLVTCESHFLLKSEVTEFKFTLLMAAVWGFKLGF